MVGEDTITRILIKGSRVTCLAILTIMWSSGILLLDGSKLGTGGCSIVADLVRIGIWFECLGTTFRYSGKSFQMYRCMKCVFRSISTVKFLTISTQTFMRKFPIRTKRRIVPCKVILTMIALGHFSVGWLSSCVSYRLGSTYC